MVRELRAATKQVQKHRFGGLIGPRHIYANTRGLSTLKNMRDEQQKEPKKQNEELRDRLLILQPLQPIALALCLHSPDYNKSQEERSADIDEIITEVGNEASELGNVVTDFVMIRRGLLDHTHPFHELYGIAHDTAQPYIGIYSSPLQLLYVY